MDDRLFQRIAKFVDGLQVAGLGRITLFSDDGTLVGDSDNTVPTEKAVKTYVDVRQPDGSYSFVPLTEPYVSTSWDGDAKTSANNGTLDLSAVFGVPAGVKAISVRVDVSGASSAAGNGIWLSVDSGSDASLASKINVANVRNTVCGVVPCDANGDVYASIAGTITVWIYVTGYWI